VSADVHLESTQRHVGLLTVLAAERLDHGVVVSLVIRAGTGRAVVCAVFAKTRERGVTLVARRALIASGARAFAAQILNSHYGLAGR
jgi:hypothetical protein